MPEERGRGEVRELPEEKMERLCKGARQQFRAQLEEWKAKEEYQKLFSEFSTSKLIANFDTTARQVYINNQKDKRLAVEKPRVADFLDIIFDYIFYHLSVSLELFKGIQNKPLDFERGKWEEQLRGLFLEFHKKISEAVAAKTEPGKVIPFEKIDK